MATPRSLLVDPEQPMFYHLVSRCVRRAWLCASRGKGRKRGKRGKRRTDQRRAWIEERILHLAQAFAVDVMSYAVMSNHFHIVVYYDPLACLRWSDEEVAERWFIAHPPADGDVEAATEPMLADPALVQWRRQRLGSLSAFMQRLKQPISLRINREDGVKGHLFEKRFYSGALLDENAVIAAMGYVDLNPFRARIAQFLEDADFTSIRRRLRVLANTQRRLEHYLAPLGGGTGSRHPEGEQADAADAPQLHMTLAAYIELLHDLMACTAAPDRVEGPTPREKRWVQSMELIRKRQRAYGGQDALAKWLQRRNMRPLEKATDLDSP